MTQSPLTDTQLIILSAAAQRKDLRIELPERLRGGAAKAVLSTLLAKYLIEPHPSLRDEHAPPDSKSLEGSAYRISVNGLAAIGIESETEDELAPGYVDECAAGSDQSAVMPPKAGAPFAARAFRSEFLRRALAHEIQVAEFGGLSSAVKRRLRQLAAAARDGRFDEVLGIASIKPGTLLIRVWQDTTHRVMCWPMAMLGMASSSAGAERGQNEIGPSPSQ
jgi:hypothetical protein